MPVQVVAGLILRGKRLLVCQRKENGSFPLKWEFPGGKVEKGEGYLDALGRELQEELGIEIESATEFFRHRHSYCDQTDQMEVELIFFRVKNYKGVVTNKAFEQIGWIGVNELRELDFLEGDLPLVDKLVRQGLAR